jgi:acyl carrier protein
MTENLPESAAARIQAALRPHLRLLDPDRPIPMNESLGKLGLDSMGAINLLFDLEQAFQIKIPDAILTAETFETGAALEKAIRPLIEQKPDPPAG